MPDVELNPEPWVPFLGTIFLFVLGMNWSGALVPWHLLESPNGELAAPTNDINTTVALALLTSIAYFYAGVRTKRAQLNNMSNLLLCNYQSMFMKILQNPDVMALMQPASTGVSAYLLLYIAFKRAEGLMQYRQ